MEFEQIAKRLEWLDEQQRKNKEAASEIKDRLTSLETSISAFSQQMKTLTKEFSELGTAAARLNQFDEILAKQRAELNKALEAVEKNTQRREREIADRHQAELKEINASVSELSATFVPELLKKQSKDQTLEVKRLSLAVQDMQSKVEEALKKNADVLSAQKEQDEVNRQNIKRMMDIQGDLTSIRKRADDAREKTVLHSDGIRNIENRLKELFEAESVRKESQTAFLEQQASAQVERDRTWRDFQTKYEAFKKQAENMDAQVSALDDTIRAAKRAQDAYNELNQKLERRIAEVSEMQRLAEDRVRQEWVAFKADEQKRWTSHSLAQEEAMRDLRKNVDKLESRVTFLDDASQTLQDQLHQTASTTEQQLQELMNVSHEWLSAYERIMGHGKTKAKKSSK